MEKAFDRVPREVISWAMHKLGVDVMSMYSGAKTVVRTVYGDSKSFEVKVGMHQGSSLSPRLFVIVIRYDTRCYFNVRSKSDISPLNLPHGTDN